MTVLEGIRKSADFLSRKGVDSPRLQSELLLAHALGIPRLKLYLDFDRQLVPGEVEALRGFVQRRASREPLQHIVGRTSVCGFEINVARSVLIPRPETEILAERAWETINALTLNPRVLDFGTGSGCIAIALATKCPRAEVHACDVSSSALEMAQRNAAANQVGHRIQFRASDGFSAFANGEEFDVIVSNPPYIPTAEIQTLEREVKDHDPLLALDGGTDGLAFYRLLATEGGNRLSPGGCLLAEFGDGQAESLHSVFAEAGWGVECFNDYSGRARILIARKAKA